MVAMKMYFLGFLLTESVLGHSCICWVLLSFAPFRQRIHCPWLLPANGWAHQKSWGLLLGCLWQKYFGSRTPCQPCWNFSRTILQALILQLSNFPPLTKWETISHAALPLTAPGRWTALDPWPLWELSVVPHCCWHFFRLQCCSSLISQCLPEHCGLWNWSMSCVWLSGPFAFSQWWVFYCKRLSTMCC